MVEGATFNDSDLGTTSTEGAKLNYESSVDSSTPGTYNVTITAINSQGTEATPVTVKAKAVTV